MAPTEAKQSAPAAWKSLVAGATAGAVEGFTTYPFEYAKTMMQFGPSANAKAALSSAKQERNPLRLLYHTVTTKGVSSIYVGCSSLVAGTAAKAAVRFVAFDSIKSTLVDENGKISGGRAVLAGLGAGVCESLLAVTPFETVKTALIEDGRRRHRQYRGLVHGSMSLVKERGIGGIYRGATAVTLRQGANSGVRMGSYSWLKGLYVFYLCFHVGLTRSLGVAQSRQEDPSKSLSSQMTFGIGVIAGIITVYTTMPFDTVKTRMQSLQAKGQYKSTLDCAIKIATTEGIGAFWSGSTARLGRLMVRWNAHLYIPYPSSLFFSSAVVLYSHCTRGLWTSYGHDDANSALRRTKDSLWKLSQTFSSVCPLGKSSMYINRFPTAECYVVHYYH